MASEFREGRSLVWLWSLILIPRPKEGTAWQLLPANSRTNSSQRWAPGVSSGVPKGTLLERIKTLIIFRESFAYTRLIYVNVSSLPCVYTTLHRFFFFSPIFSSKEQRNTRSRPLSKNSSLNDIRPPSPLSSCVDNAHNAF